MHFFLFFLPRIFWLSVNIRDSEPVWQNLQKDIKMGRDQGYSGAELQTFVKEEKAEIKEREKGQRGREKGEKEREREKEKQERVREKEEKED